MEEQLTTPMADEKVNEKTKNPANLSNETIDIITAILLMLATIASTWCAYQSNLWNGIQTFNLADANALSRLASENRMEALEKRGLEGSFLVTYIEAMARGDKKLADFYFSRFDSTLQHTTTEWLKHKPFVNPDAPRSPLRMEGFVLNEDIIAEKQKQASEDKHADAQHANVVSDTYVLYTVLFGVILFFCGIGSSARSHRTRIFCLFVASILFVIILALLTKLPVTGVG